MEKMLINGKNVNKWKKIIMSNNNDDEFNNKSN